MTTRTTTAARSVADLNEGIILATVDIDAPAERVFRALTSEEITQWWGSDDSYRTTEWKADVRQGGSWRAGGRNPDGTSFGVQGEFLEIDPPHKLVQTWKADWDDGKTTVITYRLQATPTGTRLTLRHEGFAGRPESCQLHADGWTQVLGWLDAHVSQKAPGGSFFLLKLLPPRPTFPADMTPAEGEVMQAHVGYWTELMKRRAAFAFGPVLDPAGVWGLGLLCAQDAAAAQAIRDQDPAVRSGLGFRMEIVPMLNVVVPG
jgi:uncharacterized protein YndB with AHSA1/START domain